MIIMESITRQRKRETRTRQHKQDKVLGAQNEANDSGADPQSDEPSAPPPPKDDTPEILKDALKNLPPRWKNWWVRIFFSSLMILSFVLIVWGGPFFIMLLVLAIQVKCFHEIITIGHQFYRTFELPWFRSLSWYFLVCANYFIYLEARSELFGNLTEYKAIGFLLKYHRLISFCLYLIGFILFVLSLVKKKYRIQFFMFGWTHVTQLIIVTQSHFIMTNLLEGIIWLLLPSSLIIGNDIMAYICGFFLGRTPLIKLSPKKTWEGFIGGGVFTVILGWFMSGYLSQFSYLTCPTEIGPEFVVQADCEVSSTFVMTEYQIPMFVQVLLKLVGLNFTSFEAIPFQLHCVVISLFTSIIAPFGGFFASGFKRAFKVKDFDDIIPGHGGFVDRFDCQYLVGTFVHVYMSTFIRVPTPSRILPSILAMKLDDQVWLFERLQEHLNKDFDDIIPGHGGFVDRFDCQYLVGTFVHIYMSTFIRVPTPSRILPSILAMKLDDQVWLFERLQEHLNKGL